MRQYVDRLMTPTRHPAVFTICIQRDGLMMDQGLTYIRQHTLCAQVPLYVTMRFDK